jgi:hypothetical protein
MLLWSSCKEIVVLSKDTAVNMYLTKDRTDLALFIVLFLKNKFIPTMQKVLKLEKENIWNVLNAYLFTLGWNLKFSGNNNSDHEIFVPNV